MQSIPTGGHLHAVHFLVIDADPGTYQKLERTLEKCSEVQYSLTWCHDLDEALGEIRCFQADQERRQKLLNGSASITKMVQPDTFVLPDPLIVIGNGQSRAEEDQLIGAGAFEFLATDHLNRHSLQRLLAFSDRLREKERALSYLSQFDRLTGTLNREGFLALLSRNLDEARASGLQVGLMRLSVDGLRRISNSLGCELGQETLLQVAKRLKSCLHGSQELARLGDDQFAITLLSSKADAELWALCQRIEKLKARPYHGKERSIILGCSMGCATGVRAEADSAILMRNAGIAMHLAEAEAGSSYRFYQEGLDQETSTQLTLEPELIRALKRDELVLHYQPRFDLKSRRIIGAEALVRWNHPSRGLVYPGEFVPLAEKNGLIVPLGYWVIYQAGEDLKWLRDTGAMLGRVGINLSFRQFQDDKLLPTIQQLMKKQQFADGQLEFELTETAMALNEQHTRDCIRALSKYGAAFSLDDFGTGYSSFTHLQKLPISTLKIDRSFVQGVTTNSDDAEIVRAIIHLAHNLRMEVIAEGAETPEQVQFLADSGCDQVQGYYFSPPVTRDELQKMILGREPAADKSGGAPDTAPLGGASGVARGEVTRLRSISAADGVRVRKLVADSGN